jgi:hypothetical protein
MSIPAKVNCLSIHQNHVVVGIDTRAVLFKVGQKKLVRTLTQRQGIVRSVSISSEGLVAVGSDESDITMVNIFKPDFAQTVSGHKVSPR